MKTCTQLLMHTWKNEKGKKEVLPALTALRSQAVNFRFPEAVFPGFLVNFRE